MKVTHTPEQLDIFIKLLKDKGVNPARFQRVLATGYLGDIFDKDANLNRIYREHFRKDLDLESKRFSPLALIRMDSCPSTEEFDLFDFFRDDNPLVTFHGVDRRELEYNFEDSRIIPAEDKRTLFTYILTIDANENEFVLGRKTTWSDLKLLLLQQPHGQDGALDNNDGNGRMNLFLIGKCMVTVSWYKNYACPSIKEGWHIKIHPKDELPDHKWLSNMRFIARK